MITLALTWLCVAFGLVTKTGILLVDYTNTLRKRGMARTQALSEAARVRLGLSFKYESGD